MIPKTVKAEQKLALGNFNFTIKRIFGLFATIVISAIIAKLMPKALGIGFIIFCLILYFVLTGKAPSNPLKPFYEGLLDFVLFKTAPKKIYATKSKEWQESEQQRKEMADAKNKKKVDKKE